MTSHARRDGHPRQGDGRTPKRGSLLPIALVVGFVVLLAASQLVGAAFGWGLLAKRDKPAEQSEPVEQAAPQPEVSEEVAPPVEEPPAEPAPDTRAAEFAVDPARTDWNYEPGDAKVVYLTFDDGPSANTAAVLDILDQYGIKATFFVTGINPEYLDMIGECYRRGHTIGMHTYTHDYAQVYASLDAYWDDLNQISEVVRAQIGYVPCFIRFPGGSSNTISANYTSGIMSELSQQVQDAGYQYYDWDASCGDGAEHTADELVDATMEDTSYGYTSIVFLAHDGAEKQTTVEALPRIIEYFQQEGYSFAPLDRQTCVPHHGIGN
ncbi:MAG: polysaccharide deacetylase [Atopobiaceae bacterium]|nr:polysaccharide deacetylase [Atopobiaceae bacterium]